MTTLTEFLLARLAEDEAHARALGGDVADLVAYPPGSQWDPADRLAADFEAKRRIVALYRQWEDAGGYPPAYWDAPVDLIVQALATVYADHPDYQQEWSA